MTKPTETDRQPWHEEIKSYANRGTEGLSKDMAALEAHIKKLHEICPKDSTGFPHTAALIYLNRLQNRLDEVKQYLSAAAG
jgi:hypothetical protein